MWILVLNKTTDTPPPTFSPVFVLIFFVHMKFTHPGHFRAVCFSNQGRFYLVILWKTATISLYLLSLLGMQSTIDIIWLIQFSYENSEQIKQASSNMFFWCREKDRKKWYQKFRRACPIKIDLHGISCFYSNALS